MKLQRITIRPLLILLALISFSMVYAEVEEEKLKAVLIEKVAQFVTWPVEIAERDTIKIGIIGSPSFYREFAGIYESREFLSKSLIVEKPNKISELGNYQILILGDKSVFDTKDVIRQLRKSPTLTICENKRCITSGIMLGFSKQFSKIEFMINYKAVKEAGLMMSYHLLRSAEVIGMEE